jgi:hypothetical protein
MLEHILRRMGFGTSADDRAYYGDLSPIALVQTLLAFERVEDNVDAKIGLSDVAGITTRGPFSPDTVIGDARQRWLNQSRSHFAGFDIWGTAAES